ncbi:tautomerase family protein [Rhodococcus pyridinivorans]|uniref:tautomerase family protein n=1 Tax=Rhodococcus pyridinivorans TaxID=103816 RepID=UPI00110E114F|nr:tautomerase family protein [Rhodococcus pyridinivorans]
MPVAHFHLIDGTFTIDQRRRLLTEASHCYAQVLDSPLDRVRTFVVPHTPDDAATAGVLISGGGDPAPYFTAIVLAGRSLEQRQRLASRFTDLLVDILEVPRSVVRGQIVEVDPNNWFIGGVAAAAMRAEEIAARTDSTSA